MTNIFEDAVLKQVEFAHEIKDYPGKDGLLFCVKNRRQDCCICSNCKKCVRNCAANLFREAVWECML